MNKYLSQNYAFRKASDRANYSSEKKLSDYLKNPNLHFVFFAIAMCVVAYLSVTKVLPYSLQTGLAITFSYAISSIGFCLLMGYSGLASLGTGGFIGIGTYAVYYIMGESGLSLGIAVLVSLGVAILIGIIVGFISLRIEGIYLVILTLGLSEILRNLYMVIEDSISVSSIKIFGMTLRRQDSMYLIVIVLSLIMIVTNNLINSPTGRAMLAMKNSTAAAQAMGISLIKYRLMAFVICTAYSSLTGVMLMVCIRTAMASNGTGFYALITSLNILAAVIIGGFKSIWGAVFGTYIMYGIQTTLLNQIPFFQKNPEIITFISGGLVIIVVMFYPGGLAQLLTELKGKLKGFKARIKEGIYGKDLG